VGLEIVTGDGCGAEISCDVGAGMESVAWMVGFMLSSVGGFDGTFESASPVAGSFSAISSSATSGVAFSTGRSESDEEMDSMEPLLALCTLSVSEELLANDEG
jgi:hypothetical protein